MRTRVLAIPLVLGFIIVMVQKNIFDTYSTTALVASYDQWTIKECDDIIIEERIISGMRAYSRHWKTADGEPVVMGLQENIRPGEYVKKGQTVLKIWNPWAGLEYNTAKARLIAERSELAVLEASSREEELATYLATIRSAHLDKEKNELAFARASSLYASELTSLEEYETARYNYRSACSYLEKAEADFTLVKAGTSDEIRDAKRAEIHVCEMELEEASARSETTAITSPIDGNIVQSEPDILLCIQKTDTVLVYIPVEQNHIHTITVGAPVEITGPGGIHAEGTVIHIGQTAQAVGDRIAISVVVMVRNPQCLLKPGMTVTTKIEV